MPFAAIQAHEHATQIPTDDADRLARLAVAHGSRYRPAEIWAQKVRDQRKFY